MELYMHCATNVTIQGKLLPLQPSNVDVIHGCWQQINIVTSVYKQTLIRFSCIVSDDFSTTSFFKLQMADRIFIFQSLCFWYRVFAYSLLEALHDWERMQRTNKKKTPYMFKTMLFEFKSKKLRKIKELIVFK